MADARDRNWYGVHATGGSAAIGRNDGTINISAEDFNKIIASLRNGKAEAACEILQELNERQQWTALGELPAGIALELVKRVARDPQQCARLFDHLKSNRVEFFLREMHRPTAVAVLAHMRADPAVLDLTALLHREPTVVAELIALLSAERADGRPLAGAHRAAMLVHRVTPNEPERKSLLRLLPIWRESVVLLEALSPDELAWSVLIRPPIDGGRLLDFLATRPNSIAGTFLTKVEPVRAAPLIEHMDPEVCAALLLTMRPPEALRLLGGVSDEQVTEVLTRLGRLTPCAAPMLAAALATARGTNTDDVLAGTWWDAVRVVVEAAKRAVARIVHRGPETSVGAAVRIEWSSVSWLWTTVRGFHDTQNSAGYARNGQPTTARPANQPVLGSPARPTSTPVPALAGVVLVTALVAFLAGHLLWPDTPHPASPAPRTVAQSPTNSGPEPATSMKRYAKDWSPASCTLIDVIPNAGMGARMTCPGLGLEVLINYYSGADAYQRRRPDRLAGEYDIHDVTGPRRWSRDDGRQGDYFLYRSGRGEQEIGYIWLGDPATNLAVIVNGRWQSDLRSSWDHAVILLWHHGYVLSSPGPTGN